MASLGNYGIMTLSRGPYNELDKMSLFQDLKLKRRKVDSRCSSDGESLADTSTSSPDLPPLSPKTCDANQGAVVNPTSVNSNQSQSTSNSPPLLSTSPPGTDHHEASITASNKRNSQHDENPSTTTAESHHHHHQQQQQQHLHHLHHHRYHPTATNGSSSNNNNNSGSGISVIMENRPRSHSPAPSSPIRRTTPPVNTLLQQTLTQSLPPTSTSNDSQHHVTVLVTPPRIKSESQLLMNAMTRKMPPTSSIPQFESHSLPMNAPLSGLSQLQHHHQINQVQIPFTSAAAAAAAFATTTAIANAQQQGFKRNLAGQISPNHPYMPSSPVDVQQRIKRERSPNGNQLTIIPQQNHQMRQQSQQLSPHQIPISSANIFHGSPLQMRGTQGLRDATMLFRIKNEPQMSIPQAFMTSNAPQRMMWGPPARINGVKPEVIGGPLPPLRPPHQQSQSPPQQQSSPKHNNSNNSQARATPTVIMGESCGVRTMVWSFEPVVSAQQQQQQVSMQQQQVQNSNSPIQSPPGTSQNSNHSTSSTHSSSNNEEAAHLLLSLGQGVRPIMENRARAINRPPHALNMERLWAGDYSQLPAGQQMHALNLSAQQQTWMGQHPVNKEHGGVDDITNEEDDQPLVCMICEDKATGLHYGIITCEGCKGFFKRTVQNRRVYTCVADGTCEITKAQRNRCQYCRFKKCIEQGMVLQAVREDRMPGGRNSGAVYNLYKVKYKKHKKNSTQKGVPGAKNSGSSSDSKSTSPSTTNAQQMQPQIKQQQQDSNLSPPSLLNGNILKAALTNPAEINHLRHRLDNAVSSSRDRSISFDNAINMIQTLIDCDAMEDIATLPHFSAFLEDKSEISDKLCNIGDSIVHKLVSWTKKLPFYLEIPVEIHTKLLTDKWHEILVLTTATYQAMHGRKFTQPQQAPPTSIAPDKHDPEFTQEVNAHLQTLQTCLTTLMGHSISMEQLKIDVGLMVEKMTQITIMFRRIKLRMEEYVCLKVYILLNREVELESQQERYIQVLRSYLQHTSPHNPGRLGELLAHIPEIQTAANLLLESKMFYVPFVLNSATNR